MREQQLNNLWCEEDSFAWVWTSELGDWLKSMKPFFWIAGKPASGKSTLINYVSKASQLEEALSLASPDPWCICYHFFDFRAGVGAANNFNGVLRTLLYQLLSKLPHAAQQTKKRFERGSYTESDWVNDSAALRGAFDFALSTTVQPVLLLLDGLDEYEGNMIELTQWVLKLNRPNTKVCLSSRPDPDLLAAFRAFPSVRMDIANRPGIRSFLQETLKAQPSLSRHGAKFVDEMVEDISSRSQGVFLWTRFAVYEVIAGDNRREDPQAIQKRLQALPKELNEIYSRIFNRMDLSAKFTAGLILHLVTTSLRPLRLSELFQASILAGAITWNSAALADEVHLRDFEHRLLDIGGGLLETVRVGRLKTTSKAVLLDVRIVHRTVQTYLEKLGWTELLHDEAPSLRRHTWLRICTEFLHQPSKRVAWVHPETATPDDSTSNNATTDNTTDSNRGSAEPGTDRIAQISLDLYIFANLPAILESGGDSNAQLSWTEVSHLFTEELIFEHIQLSGTHVQVRYCPCKDVAFLVKNFRAGIQLAVVHRNCHHVEQYLSGGDSSATTAQFPLSKDWAAMTEGSSTCETETSAVDAQELYNLAAFCASLGSPIGGFLSLIREISQDYDYSPQLQLLARVVTRPLEDATMLRLLREGSAADIELCLAHFPPGKIVLKSSFFCTCFTYGTLGCKCEESESIQHYSPLWAIAHRLRADQETRDLFDLFIGRGEDVNASNGPEETLFDAVVTQLLSMFLCRGEVQFVRGGNMIDILLSYGVRFNDRGTKDNALERLWRQLHVLKPNVRLGLSNLTDLRLLAGKLLHIGLENRRKDPNGLVPTPERMANIGRFYTEHSRASHAVMEWFDEFSNALIRSLPRHMRFAKEGGWSPRSWCMEQAYYHTGDPDRWKEFFNPEDYEEKDPDLVGDWF